MDGRCISQTELAQRWQLSESTLERWRAECIGPLFLKLRGQVRHRNSDILGKHAGSRKAADTFNRLHAPSRVCKSFVSNTILNHQHALLNISRELRNKRCWTLPTSSLMRRLVVLRFPVIASGARQSMDRFVPRDDRIFVIVSNA